MEQGQKFRIIGIFWDFVTVQEISSCSEDSNFSGEIHIYDAEGSVAGNISDAHGYAEVYGKITPDRLEFKKIYDLKHPDYSGGSELPLLYVLHKLENGGWFGTWRENENDREGMAMCILLSDEELRAKCLVRERFATLKT